MNDQTTNTTAPASAPTAPAAPKLSLDDIERLTFAPSELAAEATQLAIRRQMAIAEAFGLPVRANTDLQQPLPAGYTLSVVPIRTTRTDPATGKGVQVPVELWLTAHPTMSALMADDKGRVWAEDRVTDAVLNRFANDRRPRKDGTLPTTEAMFSLASFITVATRDGGMGAFRELAPAYLKQLRGKLVPEISTDILRSVLASAVMAASIYRTVPAERWSGLLERMIQSAAKNSLDPGILTVWRDTRDNADASAEDAAGDFDLDALTI